MGGAGKTTLAWAVFNDISYQFDGRSYIANIREVSKTSGLHFLQEKVLSDLLSERDMKVTSDLEGKELMEKRLRRKRILLVLDDVDNVSQLDALAGSREWFGMGSRIIITTRDEYCLKILEVDKTFGSVMLDDAEAIQLFSLYAFKKSRPPEKHMENTQWIVQYASGLPLALKVLGSYLYGRNMKEWTSTLKRLEVSPEHDITEILKISFDGLREMEQKIFLDIACFFKGLKRDYATRILDSFDFCADIGISILIQKSLISVSKGRLCMHDRIEEMGWHIVRKSSSKPGGYSRLWLPKDVRHVLTSETGTNAVEGIYLYLSYEDSVISFSANSLKNMHNLRKLQWLTWKGYVSESLPERFEGEKLVGLELSGSKIIQLWRGRKTLDKLSFMDLSRSIKLRSTPNLEGTPNLKSLILDYCDALVEVHPSVADLKQLIFLSLKDCKHLKSLPSPMQMESLETLILTYCENLAKFPEISENMGRLSKLHLDHTSIEILPESVGNLTGLVLMKLNGCRYLQSLPGTIGRLQCLKTLDVFGCTMLEKLPNGLEDVQTLEVLYMDNTAFKETPSFIANLRNLKALSCHNCNSLVSSMLFGRVLDSYKSGSEQNPVFYCGFIKKLDASWCNLTEGDFPGDLSNFFSLEELILSKNSFKYLPYSICQLPRLKILDISHCLNLEKVQEFPSSITEIQAVNCENLTSFLDITKYKKLWKLSMPSYEGGLKNSVHSVLQSLLQGHLVANLRFSILVPGYTIPEWFSEQGLKQHMYLQLRSGWCNEDLLGFAICADLNNHAGNITIWFDMIEAKMQDFKLTPPPVVSDSLFKTTSQVWLGFMSIHFFRLLFPKFKEDADWSNFEGNLCMQLYHGSDYCESYKCAIRLVYNDDLNEGAIIQNSLGGEVNYSTDRPWLKEHLDDDDSDNEDQEGEYNPYASMSTKFSRSTAYLKQRGRMGAEVSFWV